MRLLIQTTKTKSASLCLRASVVMKDLTYHRDTETQRSAEKTSQIPESCDESRSSGKTLAHRDQKT